MATIVTRAGKGSALTWTEGDANITNLNNDKIELSNLSVTDAGGDGSLTYNNTTGAFTYTGPSASEVRAHFSAGTGITLTNGTIATTITQYTDALARGAVSVTDAGGEGSLTYDNSTGVITYTGPSFTGLEQTANKNQANGYAGLDATGKVASAQLPSYVDDVIEAANFAALPGTGETGKIYVTIDNGKIYRWSGSAYVEISASPGSTDAVPEGSTNLYFTTQRARDAFSAGSGINITNGSISSTVSAGISNVVDDTTPQLGGNLDVNSKSIVSASNGNITLAPNGSGKTITNRLNYNEAVNGLGTTSGTVAPNVADGNVQTITLNGNLTLNAFTSPIAGQSLTLIINTNGTGRTLTSTMKFAGGEKTLSTTNTTDIISVFYDGTNYWASLAKDFK